MDARRWLRLLAAPPRGLYEAMTHPGEYDPAEMARVARHFGESWIDRSRPAELAALLDPVVLATPRRAEAVSFAALADFPP